MDELFLTMAPQFAGRSVARPRPALIEGMAFEPETAPWARTRERKAERQSPLSALPAGDLTRDGYIAKHGVICLGG